MNVQIIGKTGNSLGTVYTAYRRCYQAGNSTDAATVDKMEELVSRCIAAGHLSPLEHASITFSICGISRACSHQLVRHRIASYSQQSQRYVNEENFNAVLPASIGLNTRAADIYQKFMEEARAVYSVLETLVPKEDARYVLPNATCTNLVVTMNLRSLLHFFEERLCSKAQWEIRLMAEIMLGLCTKELPVVFAKAGPKCERLGYCPETSGCGRQHGKMQ